MPLTPARASREQILETAARDAGRAANESKFTEFDLACTAGHVPSCVALGEWWAMMRGDFKRAADLYGSACMGAQPDAQGCLQLGALLAEGRPGVARSAGASAAAYARGCAAGSAQACADGGSAVLRGSGGAAPAVVQAAALFSRGCDGGTSTTHASCCGLLAALALVEKTAAALEPEHRDARTVVARLERACGGEHANSCMRLARAYRVGALGLAVDDARADAFDERGLLWSGLSEAQARAAVRRKRDVAAAANNR